MSVDGATPTSRPRPRAAIAARSTRCSRATSIASTPCAGASSATTDDALDATQEALIAITRRIGSFDGRAQFSTWCYRVATNAALDEARRRNRRPRPVEFVPEAASTSRRSTTRSPTRSTSTPRWRDSPGAPRRGRAARPRRPRLRRDRRRARDPARHRPIAHRPGPRRARRPLGEPGTPTSERPTPETP